MLVTSTLGLQGCPSPRFMLQRAGSRVIGIVSRLLTRCDDMLDLGEGWGQEGSWNRSGNQYHRDLNMFTNSMVPCSLYGYGLID